MATSHAFVHPRTTLWAQHPALGFALALTAGCGMAYACRGMGYGLEPTPLLLALVGITSVVLYVQKATSVHCPTWLFTLVVALWWWVLGLLSHALWWTRECVAVPPMPCTLSGVVIDQPRHTDTTARLTLALVDVDKPLAGRHVSVWLRLGGRPCPRVGDAVAVTAQWRENRLHAIATTPKDSVQASFSAYQRRQGLVASAFASPWAWQALPDSVAQDYTAHLGWTTRATLTARRWRSHLAARYATLMTDTAAIAIAQSLTLGDRSGLTHDLRQTYSTAGASHVLALSGLHLGIVYGLVMGVLGAWPWGRWGRRGALFVAMAGLWGFAWLVGFPLSVVRSVLMYSLMGLAWWRMEDGFSLNNLGWAGIVILLLWPSAVADVGFQLSFVAVLGILIGLPLWHSYRPRWRVLAWGYDVLAVSLCAQIAVAPLLAYHFHTLPLYFLIANTLVAMLAPMVLALGLATLLAPWEVLAMALAQGLEWSIIALNTSLTHVASWPHSSVSLRLNAWHVALCYASLIFITLIAYRRLSHDRLQ